MRYDRSRNSYIRYGNKLTELCFKFNKFLKECCFDFTIIEQRDIKECIKYMQKQLNIFNNSYNKHIGDGEYFDIDFNQSFNNYEFDTLDDYIIKGNELLNIQESCNSLLYNEDVLSKSETLNLLKLSEKISSIKFDFEDKYIRQFGNKTNLLWGDLIKYA